MQLGLSQSTRSRYAVCQRRFELFCDALKLQPWPPSQSTLQLFVASRAGAVNAASIRQELAAINSRLVDLDLAPVAIGGTLKRILTGAVARDPSCQTPQDPMSAELLVRLLRRCEADTLDGATLACAFSFAFFGLFRVGEITARAASSPLPSLPRMADVTVRAGGLSIRLRSSKASQHKPVWVHIGATGGVCCPMAAFVNMVRIRRQAGASCDPSSFLFLLSSGQPLTRSRFARDLSYLARSATPNLNLTPRSFRIGGASALQAAAFPAHLIQAAGRWKSDTFKRYCRASPVFLFSFAHSMLSERVGGLGGSPSPKLR